MQHRLPTMFQSSGGVAEGGLNELCTKASRMRNRRAAITWTASCKGAMPGGPAGGAADKFELVVT